MGKVSNPYKFNPKDDYRSYSEINKNYLETTFRLYPEKRHINSNSVYDKDEGNGKLEYPDNNYLFGWEISNIQHQTIYLIGCGFNNSNSNVSIIINGTEYEAYSTEDYSTFFEIVLKDNYFPKILEPYLNTWIDITVRAPKEIKRAKDNLTCYFYYNYPDSYSSITNIQDYISEINNLKPKYLGYIFYGTNITDLNLTGLNLSTVESLSYLFSSTTINSLICPKIPNIKIDKIFSYTYLNTDITPEKIDFSEIKDFTFAFYRINNFSNPNIEIKIDMNSAIKASYMFSTTPQTFDNNEPKGIITLLNTNKLINMRYMFDDTGLLKINEFDTSKVTDMTRAFSWYDFDVEAINWEIDMSSCKNANNLTYGHNITPLKLKNVPKSLGLTNNEEITIINYID